MDKPKDPQQRKPSAQAQQASPEKGKPAQQKAQDDKSRTAPMSPGSKRTAK